MVSSSVKLLCLSAGDVRKCLSMREAIDLMKKAFVALSAGEAVAPLRLKMELPQARGRALFMPAYAETQQRFAVKILALNDANPGRGLPRIHAMIMLWDAQTGLPLSLMDGEYLTAMRTGAASGLATDLLARRDAGVVVIFGAGIQAKAQLQAVCQVREIRKAFVCNRTAASAEAFAAEMGAALQLDVAPAEPASAVREADIICTATNAASAVFVPDDVRPGTHINAIGSYKPGMFEIPAETVLNSKLVVDEKQACLREAGELVELVRQGNLSEKHIYAEIGEIAAGKKPGRMSRSEVTLFKSVGIAIQDLAVAGHVWERAREAGLGQEVDFSEIKPE